ncbi:hypothetical protein ACGF5O_47555 [Streptomyces sp. NPDC048291]
MDVSSRGADDAAVGQLFGVLRWTGHGGDGHSGVVTMIERPSRTD